MNLSKEQLHFFSKNKNVENKHHYVNVAKDYDDEKESFIVRQNDSAEVKNLKNKMRTLISKLSNVKKEKDTIAKEKEVVHQENMNLQNSLRHMVSGFSNSSSNFPIGNELAGKISQFYKCDCLDKFFDLLYPEELTMKGVIMFYIYSFTKVNELIDTYFEPCFSLIKEKSCLSTLEGPIMNVMRKGFQSKFEEIKHKINNESKLLSIAQYMIDTLNFDSMERQALLEDIISFLGKWTELLLCCKISDPPLLIDFKDMGKKIEYNSLLNDPFDGFIKGKQECYIILPQVRKLESDEIVTKCLVLQKDYDLGN